MNEKIISALIGLSGAVETGSKSENTDDIVKMALLCEEKKTDEMLDKIQMEKYTISPGCKTCLNPCGNTSDYDMLKFHDNQKLKRLKEEMMDEIIALVKRWNKEELPDEVYQALRYFGYDLVEDSYIKLIDKIKQMEN